MIIFSPFLNSFVKVLIVFLISSLISIGRVNFLKVHLKPNFSIKLDTVFTEYEVKPPSHLGSSLELFLNNILVSTSLELNLPQTNNKPSFFNHDNHFFNGSSNS